jgi:hypothetical protein
MEMENVLFLLKVQETIECKECTDSEKVDAIKLLVSEESRKVPLALPIIKKYGVHPDCRSFGSLICCGQCGDKCYDPEPNG